MLNPPAERRIYVGSLYFGLTEEDVRLIFSPFGKIEFVDLHKHVDTSLSKGYAFIQYENSEDAKKAREAMNG